MTNDAYDYGDPKRSDYREPAVCAICHSAGAHKFDCPERGAEASR